MEIICTLPITIELVTLQHVEPGEGKILPSNSQAGACGSLFGLVTRPNIQPITTIPSPAAHRVLWVQTVSATALKSSNSVSSPIEAFAPTAPGPTPPVPTPDENHTPSYLEAYGPFLSSKMPYFSGLRVEIQTLGDGANASSFAEYESSECVKETRGRTIHRVLRLDCGVQFQILVEVDTNFDWKDANALKLQIDFDDRSEINDSEVYLGRSNIDSAMIIQSLARTSRGKEQAQLSQLSRPIGPFKNAETGDVELVSFRTIQTRPVPTSLPGFHGGGIINVAVFACRLAPTRMPQAIAFNKEPPTTEMHSTTKIDLFNAIKQASIPRNFKSKKATPINVFVFHYHAPEQFDRLEARDRAHYSIENAGHGNRRVVPKVVDEAAHDDVVEDAAVEDAHDNVAADEDAFDGFPDPIPTHQPLNTTTTVQPGDAATGQDNDGDDNDEDDNDTSFVVGEDTISMLNEMVASMKGSNQAQNDEIDRLRAERADLVTTSKTLAGLLQEEKKLFDRLATDIEAVRALHKQQEDILSRNGL